MAHPSPSITTRPRRPLDLWGTLDLLDSAKDCLNEFRGNIADLLEDLQTGGTGSIAASFEQNADNVYRTLSRLKELAVQANDTFNFARSKDPVFLRPSEVNEVEQHRNRREAVRRNGEIAVVTVAQSAIDALGALAEVIFETREDAVDRPFASGIGYFTWKSRFLDANVKTSPCDWRRAALENWAKDFVDAWANRKSSQLVLRFVRVTAAPVMRLKLRLPRVFNAEFLLTPNARHASVSIARVCVFSLDEECSLWVKSKHTLFRMLSDWATEAADHFGRLPLLKRVMLRSREEGLLSKDVTDEKAKYMETGGVWELLEWLELYHDLFTAPCSGCGRLIKRQGLNAEFLLPHVRVFRGTPGYDQKNPGSFGKAWHQSCLS